MSLFRSLEAQKAILVSRCEADRERLAKDTAEFRHRARWIELGWDVSQTVLPRLKLLVPLLGFLIARRLPWGARTFGSLQALWQIGRRLVPLASALRSSWRR